MSIGVSMFMAFVIVVIVYANIESRKQPKVPESEKTEEEKDQDWLDKQW